VGNYTVRYWIATYEGVRSVHAEDEAQAIAKVKRWVWAQHPPVLSYERYEIAAQPDAKEQPQ
jgi:hypothetical protein